jgi:hypothetical protein
VEGQQVKLSQAGAAILHLNETQLDNVVKRFKSLLPPRTRRQERFSSEEVDGKGRDRKRARKSMSNGIVPVVISSTSVLRERYDRAQRENMGLRDVAMRRVKKVGLLLSVLDKQVLQQVYKTLGREGEPPENIEELRSEVLAMWEGQSIDELEEDAESGGERMDDD